MLENNGDMSGQTERSDSGGEVIFPYVPYKSGSDYEDAEIVALFSEIQEGIENEEELTIRDLQLKLMLRLGFDWAELAERKKDEDRYITIDDELKVEGEIQDHDYMVVLLTPDGHIPPLEDTDSMEQLILRFRKIDFDYIEEEGRIYPDRLHFLRIEHRKPSESGVTIDKFDLFENNLGHWQEEEISGSNNLKKWTDEEQEELLHELCYVIYNFRLAPQRRGGEFTGERVLGFFGRANIIEEPPFEEGSIDTGEIPHLSSFEGLKAMVSLKVDDILKMHERADLVRSFDLGTVNLDNLHIDRDLHEITIPLTTKGEKSESDKTGMEITLHNVVTLIDFVGEEPTETIQINKSDFNSITVREFDENGCEKAIYEVNENLVEVSMAAGEKNAEGQYDFVTSIHSDTEEMKTLFNRLILNIGELKPTNFPK